ncbi:sugar ABC transporter permease [Paenibacillus sp. Soil766]|uniref:carbohydrate ABC transporter permease n=1 Tax=Paenibacillus sp. Soil766 TaxID=1736404 RepID=UPI00070C00A4|nr:carbohydrate ABC transporter permease [Paenibacillus sp. Soil766]KRE98444.1 sugar ABC transporter permease [Paenibacillus sp. Soil766]
MRKKISLFQIVNFILLTGLVFSTLYPFIYMAAVSLSSNNYVIRGEITWFPKGLTLEVYKLVLNDPRILQSYINTILYVIVGTTIALLITSMGAYAISKKEMAFSKSLTFMIIFTMFFSGGLIPTFLVLKSYGIMDSIWAMTLPGAVSTWNLLVMRTFYANIPTEVEESGRMDGLTDLGIFFRIVMPLSKAAFATIGMFYAVSLWNNFMLPLLYLRDADLFPLQIILRNIVLAGQVTSLGGDVEIVDESLKYTVIMVSTVPILLVYPFLQKYFVQGAMIGAVKG